MSEYRLARSYEESGYKIIEDSIYEKNGKRYGSAKAKCFKCDGRGRLGHFIHIEGGICFACGGRGYFFKEDCRVYTDAEREKLDEQAARRKERELEKKRAEAAGKRQAWLDKYNISDGNIFVVVGCNTYEIKDELKEQGAKFYTGIGWFFGRNTVPDKLPNEKALLYNVNVEDLLYWNDIGGGPYYIEKGLDNMKDGISKMIAEINKANSGSVHVGEIKERLRNMHGTFVSARFFENEWGGKFVYTFKVGENIFTWFSQSMIDAEIKEGDEITLTGTVKDHTEYNGILQTVLSRCIVKKGSV